MKVWVLHGIGDIQFEEVKEPQPAEGEVLPVADNHKTRAGGGLLLQQQEARCF